MKFPRSRELFGRSIFGQRELTAQAVSLARLEHDSRHAQTNRGRCSDREKSNPHVPSSSRVPSGSIAARWKSADNAGPVPRFRLLWSGMRAVEDYGFKIERSVSLPRDN
jgi:hypothetical protein